MDDFMMAFITVGVLLVFFILLLISIPQRVKKGGPKVAERKVSLY
ncbi:MAG: hypothetical protein ABFS24_06940 [Pseudomonadota bacterium]